MLTFPVLEGQILLTISILCITKEFFFHLVLKKKQKLEMYVSEGKLQHEDPLC